MNILVLQEYVYLTDKYVKHSLDGGSADIYVFAESSREQCFKKVKEIGEQWQKDLDLQDEDVERGLDAWFLEGYSKSLKQDVEVVIRVDNQELL